MGSHEDILRRTREMIRKHAGSDPDKWFYANRFVFARLQLDERRTKAAIKRELREASGRCGYCGKPFREHQGIHLHRTDSSRGYSRANCVLMHPTCHRRHHAESPAKGRPPGRRPGARRAASSAGTTAVLEKWSKRYKYMPFLYWWDITPNLARQLTMYRAVEFVKKDTRERCYVPVATLKRFLLLRRMTSRGRGNWGIKVFPKQIHQLAFEPGKRGSPWLFLPVAWYKP